MQRFKRIFAAIDFSSSSDECLRQAYARAASTGAELAVCHIVRDEFRSNPLFPHLSGRQVLRVPVDLERATEAVSEQVRKITKQASDNVAILTDHGTPYAEILNQAENWKADLIVVGSHGMSNSSAGKAMGSVSRRVIRYAHCAVLVVRRGGGSGVVLAGTDFSDPALPAVSAAAHEADRTGQRLVLAHSLDLGWANAPQGAMAFGGAAPVLTAADEAEIEKATEEKLREALKQFKVSGEIRIASGPAGEALVTIAQELKAGLVVVGTTGRTGFSRVLLGSVAETVAAEAPCSVLVVRLNKQPGS